MLSFFGQHAAQKFQHSPTHLRGFPVAGVVSPEIPRAGRSGAGVGLPHFPVDAVDALRRGQGVVVSHQAEVGAGNHEGIDLPRGEVFQQRRHVIVETVPVEMARVDEAPVIGEAADVRARGNSRIKGTQPP